MTHAPADSAWDTPLEEILDACAHDFGIADIRNPRALADARQTGFVWTERPGVVCQAANRAYFERACGNPCVRAIIAPSSACTDTLSADCALIVCPRAEELYLSLHARQRPNPSATPVVDPTANIDESAVLRGAVQIDAGVRIGPRAVIRGPTHIAHDVVIEAGAIIGCDGLYAKSILGKRQHIPHFGGVEIEPDAFIHAGAVVVRSAIRGEATRIGAAAHIGIGANVGHDTSIGAAATLSSHCVIAGRARIGNEVWIGASATISNAITVGDGARVRLGAVVIRDVPPGADVSGNFADQHARTLRRLLKETSA